MATVTVNSTDVNNPMSAFTTRRRFVRVINPSTTITSHVRDPHCTESGHWVDLPPGQDHIFVRAAINSAILAYADSGTPSLIFNEMGP